LGDVVTPDQQRQYNAAIDQSLARAQASLAAIANRQLSKDQQALVEQIRNIMQQAQASRNSDLPGAKSLAGRAEVLDKDLAGSFH
jgi:replicative DNA helicase